jgi:alpha-1,6-mannosyltransferase
VTTRAADDVESGHATTSLLAVYVIVVLLLVLVSARLWWHSPLRVIQHEFDYFLGLFDSPDAALSETWVGIGRRLHLFGFALVGALYLLVIRRLLQSPSSPSTRSLVAWSAAASLFFAIGMPWVSPDVFFYIGSGWLDSHYGVSPYLASVSSVPATGRDPMFANIYPGILGGVTSYGPLFQQLAAFVAGLSGGSEKLALALYKVVGLALHAGCSALVWRLAPKDFKRVALFSYAANPLICFSVLTCAHNDHLMNLCVLLALLGAVRRRWFMAGVALGAGFGMKYFPLVFFPVFGLAALVQQREGAGVARNAMDAARFVGGFLGIVVLAYVRCPQALNALGNVATSGIEVYRNCVYYFLDAFTLIALPDLFGTPAFRVSQQGIAGELLRGAYVVFYAVMLLALTRRLRRDPLRGIAEGCLAATMLYFILVNTSNQEWYLTWLMGLALVLADKRAHSLAWWLSAAFLPLVIYTVNSPSPYWLIANVALYCLVLVLGGSYLTSLARTLLPARDGGRGGLKKPGKRADRGDAQGQPRPRQPEAGQES